MLNRTPFVIMHIRRGMAFAERGSGEMRKSSFVIWCTRCGGIYVGLLRRSSWNWLTSDVTAGCPNGIFGHMFLEHAIAVCQPSFRVGDHPRIHKL